VIALLASLHGAAAEEAPTPVALVVSGGVSLGSYQAGFLYYLTEATRRHPERLDLSVLTGTSAGSINAFLTAVASCRPGVADPRESLFYETWMPVGFDDLFQPDEATAVSALSRSAFDPAVAALREEFERGLREGCERTLGFTTTRVTPHRTALDVLSEIPRSEERFSVVMEGRGYGRPPSLRSLVLPDHRLPQPVLPLADAADPFGVLLDVVYASSAFPLAFSPVEVAFCSTRGVVDDVPPCPPDEIERVELVDGALFDNTPLRLAVELSRARGLPPGPLALLPTDALAWPRPSSGMADPGAAGGTLGLIQEIGQGFVETAQQSELRVVVEQYPDVYERLFILRGVLPSHSESLFAFAGFFEQGFREADFYQGMAAAHLAIRDAERSLGGAVMVTAAPERERPSMAIPRSVTARRPGWKPFECLVALLTEDRPRARACQHIEVTPLRPLFQVALDRLYAECSRLGDDGYAPMEIGDRRCRDALEGGPPPLVPGLDRPSDLEWRRRPDEDWLGHQLRRLYAHRFVWVDEGLGVARPAMARRHLRDRLAQPALALARGNAASGNRVVRLLAEFGLNQLSYAVPQQLFYVGVGAQVEAGWSVRAGSSGGEWLRVGGVLAFDGLTSPFASGDPFVAATPLIEVQLEPVPLSSALIQPRLGLQLGYRFSTADRLSGGDCAGEGQICTQPAIRLHAGVSLAQRLRAQFGVGLYPSAGGAPTSVQLLPQIAVQVPLSFR